MSFRMEKPGLDPEQLRRILTGKEKDPDVPENAGSETSGTDSGEPAQATETPIEFHLKPTELIEHLDKYVVGQQRTKAVLSTKICTHFNRLSLERDEDEDIVGRIKNNVLMIGPTGVGKTFLVRLIARHLGVPFVKADATKFSETGYVGGDVEDLVRELVNEAGGQIELAEHGIIYIDEIDKIAASGRSSGPDVSRTGVQRNLLKLMEETEVDLRSPHDLSSQMESVMQMQKTGKVERKKVNTRDILFVVSGAFSGLDEIVHHRLHSGTMGFRQSDGDAVEESDEDPLRHVRSEDLMEYGFESEFIGRLPVLAILNPLRRDDLLQILRSDNSSVILSKVRDFQAYGIHLEFTDEALEGIADRAFEERTGARGLVSAVEKILISYECRLPSLDIDHFRVTQEIVNDPEGQLESFLLEESLNGYCRRFEADHGVHLTFTNGARTWLMSTASERDQLPRDLCAELFSDYGHGLKLLEIAELTVDDDIVRAPADTLDRMIREYYARRESASS